MSTGLANAVSHVPISATSAGKVRQSQDQTGHVVVNAGTIILAPSHPCQVSATYLKNL